MSLFAMLKLNLDGFPFLRGRIATIIFQKCNIAKKINVTFFAVDYIYKVTRYGQLSYQHKSCSLLLSSRSDVTYHLDAL